MSDSNLEFRMVDRSDLNRNFLNKFNRYQEVYKVWRTVDDRRVIKDIRFTEDWDDDKKRLIIEELVQIVENGGHVFGAFDGCDLIGFSAVGGSFLDPNHEYFQLIQLHVSYEYRRRRIGEELFRCCIEQAREDGASKLYISGHSAVESQAFYTRVGCVDAVWICEELVELEPCDCQLEYVIH